MKDVEKLRVLAWLEHVRSGAGKVSAPHGSETNLDMQPPSPKIFLTPSKAMQDGSRTLVSQDSMSTSLPHGDHINRYAPLKPRSHSAGHPDVIRLRELGLITKEDFDRASVIQNTESIDADDSVSHHGNHCQSSPRLVVPSASYPGTKSSKQSSTSSDILEIYFDPSERKTAKHTPPTGDEGDDEMLQYKHATEPYLGETKRLSLVTRSDSEDAESQRANITDQAEIKIRPEQAKANSDLIDNSSKSTREVSCVFDPKKATQPGTVIYGGTGCPKVLNGPFNFSKPQPRRESLTPSLGVFLHEDAFELIPSEASDETAESFCTGDGEVMTLHEAVAEQAFIKNNIDAHPYPQTAHVEGTFGRNRDIQIPIFPYTHQTTRCRAFNCPIKGKHEKGPYLHDGKLRTRDGNLFGASNPPRVIWEAYDRIKDDDGSVGGKDKARVAAKDVKIVTNFARHHFGQTNEWGVGGSESDYRCDCAGAV